MKKASLLFVIILFSILALPAQRNVLVNEYALKAMLKACKGNNLILFVVCPDTKAREKSYKKAVRDLNRRFPDLKRDYLVAYADTVQFGALPSVLKAQLPENLPCSFLTTPDLHILGKSEGVLDDSTLTALRMDYWSEFVKSGLIKEYLKLLPGKEKTRENYWNLAAELLEWEATGMQNTVMEIYGERFSPLNWENEMDVRYFLQEIDRPAHPEMARFFDQAAELEKRFPGIIKSKLDAMTFHYVIFGSSYSPDELALLKQYAFDGMQIVQPGLNMDFDTFVREWLPVKVDVDLD